MPFAYAEAGHLTHGYPTAIHKAQGTTVDRCFVLADDTMTHLHRPLPGPTRQRTVVVAEERRLEERHTAEIDSDPLDAVRCWQAAVSRPGAGVLDSPH